MTRKKIIYQWSDNPGGGSGSYVVGKSIKLRKYVNVVTNAVKVLGPIRFFYLLHVRAT